MISKYQQGYRRMLVDMHIADWNPAFLSRYNPAAMATLFERARLTSVMVYCKSHVGLCYWPTKYGKMHEGIGGRDVVGEMVEELRARDIAVCAYYSIVFDNWAVETHPEWGQRLVSGGDLRDAIRYGTCCPNHPEYRAYEMAQLEDLLSSYRFDAIFLDMLFWPLICGCDHCRARYRDESGKDIPSTVSWTSPEWCEFQSARERWIDEFTGALMAKINSVSPGIAVTHNFAPALANWVLGQPIAAARHDTFVAGDLYGDRIEQLVVSKMLLHLSETRPAEFMTSLCVNLADHVRVKSEEQMRVQAAAATAMSSGFLFIDAINPDGTVNDEMYDRVGRVFASAEPYEEHLGGAPVEDVAVYFSGHSQMDFAEHGPVTNFIASKNKYPHLDAVRGACRALAGAHVPFGVITRRQIDDLDKFKVVILPNVLRMDAEEVRAFREYVHRGGRIYASRYSSLVESNGALHDDFMLADVFGASYEAEEQGVFVYLKPIAAWVAQTIAPQKFVSFRTTHDPIRPPIPLCGIPRLRAVTTATKLATLTVPYEYPSRGSVNDHRWASVHSSPPWEDLDIPMMVSNEFGAGRAIYSSASIEVGSGDAESRLFIATVRSLLGAQASFSAETHPAVWMSVFDQSDRKRLMISFLNFQAELPIIAVPAKFSIHAPCGRAIKSLTSVPDGRALEFSTDANGTVSAKLESINLLTMVMANYE